MGFRRTKSLKATRDSQGFLMRQKRWLVISGLTILLLGLAGKFVMAVRDSREAARQTACRGHFCQLNLALSNYQEVYGSLPPAYVADANGKPMHSWRVLILPFMDGKELYKKYRFDEPWNSPHNSQLQYDNPRRQYCCPGCPDPGQSLFTNYVVIAGPGTAFPGATSTQTKNFEDGDANTILIAEINNSDIHWMEPRDLSFETMSFQLNDPIRPSISSPHPKGPAVCFHDVCGGIRLHSSITPITLRALTTISGHEPVARDRLIKKDPHLLEE